WIVGTTPDYIDLYHGALASGRAWSDRMQAVFGATVAGHTGLGIGDRFVGSHGLAEGGPIHGDSVYTVTGVLKPTGTVLDRLVVVNTESIWFVHEGNISDPIRHFTRARFPPPRQRPVSRCPMASAWRWG